MRAARERDHSEGPFLPERVFLVKECPFPSLALTATSPDSSFCLIEDAWISLTHRRASSQSHVSLSLFVSAQVANPLKIASKTIDRVHEMGRKMTDLHEKMQPLPHQEWMMEGDREMDRLFPKMENIFDLKRPKDKRLPYWFDDVWIGMSPQCPFGSGF